jgi:hypothetical protein
MLKSKIKKFLKKILPHFYVEYHIKKKNERLNFTSEEPEIYNESGEKLKTIFLSDEHYQQYPYFFVLGRYPRYIFWDRYNHGLKNHFYTHDRILSTIGKPQKKFALFIESETITPHFYKLFDKKPSLAKEFDLVFTNSDKLLNNLENSAFFPGGGVYYGTKTHGGELKDNQYQFKTKNISIVSSFRTMCRLHEFRLEAARYYKNNNLADTFGTFDGGSWAKADSYLRDYRYSIVIENNISSYWFTEKILNCFASMTVPIYIGATKISEYFNSEGIIQIKAVSQNEVSLKALDDAVKSCGERDYNSRISAITDNYNRVREYLCIEDYIYTHYGKHFI